LSCCLLTSLLSALQVSPDLLAGCVALGAGSGYSNNCDTSLLREGLDVLSGNWPPRR